MQIGKVGIVGAGTMGSGIATNIAQHGYAVRVVDMSVETADRGLQKASGFYARQVERGRMTAEEAEAAKARLTGGTDLEVLGDCDLVIEAVFERTDVKHALYEKLNPILREDAILATNTSCLRVSSLAEAVQRPQRFLGMHYFNPPAVNPIVEVVRGEKTDAGFYDAALAFCRATGKMTVACRDSNGFAINRYFCPYVNEAVRVFDEGLGTSFEIDRVACEVVGAAAGPFVVINLVGPQVVLHAQENLRPLGPFYEPAASVIRHGEGGALWEIDEPTPPDAERDRKIAGRLLGATFLPVLQELDEQVATPEEIDLGARHALKFGKPPCALMDTMGREAVEALIRPVCETYAVSPPRTLARIGALTA